ncbi:hypothetical protein ACFYO1_01950 [Nocardia sp. NPDC006044]|uniref:hypothetical protein n=1 Tax=Nocardia sp. NPDC006044 TaxID=3364306 RepID=UPI0036A39969
MIEDLIELLRRLAGRMPDEDLRKMRHLLGFREIDTLLRLLPSRLMDLHVGLTKAEFELLVKIGFVQSIWAVGDLLDTGFLPEYGFRAMAEWCPEDDELLTAAVAAPSLLRVLKTQRNRASAFSSCPSATVYVAVLAKGADVARHQAQLQRNSGSALVEAMLEGEWLPPYQAAALATGTQIWSRGVTV